MGSAFTGRHHVVATRGHAPAFSQHCLCMFNFLHKRVDTTLTPWDIWEEHVSHGHQGSWMHPLDPNLPPILACWLIQNFIPTSLSPAPHVVSKKKNETFLRLRHLEKRAIVKIRGLQCLVTFSRRFGVSRKVAHLIPIFGEGKNDIHQMDSNGLFCFKPWNKIQLPLLDFK